jgi:hypothetical protein
MSFLPFPIRPRRIHTCSPLGYKASNYDKGKQELELKVDGHSYLCLLRVTDKKANTGTNFAAKNMCNTASPYGPSGNYNYDPAFSDPVYDYDFDWDGLDDDFDFDWWNDLGEL